MFFIFTLVVESFVAFGASESIHARVFRFMILFSLNCFENLATIIARIPFALMTPHVQLKIVIIIVTFSTNATEMRVFSCVVSSVHIESSFSIECFATFITPPYFQFCTQALLLLKFIQLFIFLLSELDM